MSVESVRRRIKNLRKTFESFAQYPDSRLTQSTRLQYINNNIQSLLNDQIYIGTLKTVREVEIQAQQFVKELESKLEEIGLVRDVNASSETGRRWIVPESARLVAQDLNGAKIMRKGKAPQQRQIAGYRGPEEDQIMDVDMVDEDDCVITLVVDKKRQGEDFMMVERQELRRSKRMARNDLMEDEENQDGITGECRQAHDVDHDNDDGNCLQRFDTEKRGKDIRIEFPRLDELLWYQPSKHFDEDMLP